MPGEFLFSTNIKHETFELTGAADRPEARNAVMTRKKKMSRQNFMFCLTYLTGTVHKPLRSLC